MTSNAKRIIALLFVLPALLSSLHVYAEDEREASLSIGCFPAELCGRYMELTPDDDAAQRLLALLSEVDFTDMPNDYRAFPDNKEASLGI